MAQMRVDTTAIEGLLVVQLPVPADDRGWFKENWQREKMVALGLPDFSPVQHNIAFNAHRGTTRGVHAEPWDKLVSVVTGRIFGAWVDLREGPGFGTTVTIELGPEQAVFVPRGVGNSYQTLDDATSYTYLVNDHWSESARQLYTYVNLFDPALNIAWPIPREHCQLSAADRDHPHLDQVRPMSRHGRTVIAGADGQLGRALSQLLPDAVTLTRADLDITDAQAVDGFDFHGVDTLINAAAYTAVDQAETASGRAAAWQVNAVAVGHLARAARRHRLRLVQVSSDYVFDGNHEHHLVTEPLSPLGVYGQTKAAGELLAATVDQHWIVRTSWVIGEGSNFVDTMARLARDGACPRVVNDQFGRLTFATDLAQGIVHLLDSPAAPGTYHLTNTGPVQSWAEIAARTFELCGRSAADVVPITTAEWAADRVRAAEREGSDVRPIAPRPRNSSLDLTTLLATGYTPPPVDQRLREHLS